MDALRSACLTGITGQYELEEGRLRMIGEIYNFINERILTATWAIAENAAEVIKNGDRILVYGKSVAVQCAILQVRSST